MVSRSMEDELMRARQEKQENELLSSAIGMPIPNGPCAAEEWRDESFGVLRQVREVTMAEGRDVG